MTRRLFEVLRFIVAGGAAALANWGSRFAFSLYFNYEIAVVLAFLVGLTTGFILMRVWVFESTAKPMGRQATVYVLVNALALVQTLIISIALARWLLPAIGWHWQIEAVAHAAGVAVPVFTSYVLHKRATFR